MPKSILASLSGFASDRAVMDAALALARPARGHVDAVHLRVDVAQLAALVQTIHPHPGGGSRRLAQKFAADAQDRSEAARKTFTDICAAQRKSAKAKTRKSPTAEYREVVALEDPTPSLARLHDVTVAARVPELAPNRLGDLVMDAGKPILVPPTKLVSTVGKTVIIAWKDSREAARAITAALPILHNAKRVIVAYISESGKVDASGRASADGLVKQLRRHSITAELYVAPAGTASAAEKIREIAYSAAADLIVMGAYGHSRTREWILGGMTRSFLKDCDICVLMAH